MNRLAHPTVRRGLGRLAALGLLSLLLSCQSQVAIDDFVFQCVEDADCPGGFACMEPTARGVDGTGKVCVPDEGAATIVVMPVQDESDVGAADVVDDVSESPDGTQTEVTEDVTSPLICGESMFSSRAPCDDGVFCNGAEICDLLVGCVDGPPPSTDDGVDCTVDLCDQLTDKVTHTPDDSACSSTKVCYTAICDVDQGCVEVPLDDCEPVPNCGDGIVNGDEACDEGGPTPVCDDDCEWVTSFISVWETTVDGESITLPLREGFAYDFTVNWGDGSDGAEVTSWDDPDMIHIYATAGQHTVTIDGLLESISFLGSDGNNPGAADADKLLSVPNLGSVGWTSLDYAFMGCPLLTTVAGGDTSSVTDMSYMFAQAASATPDTGGWDISSVTDMTGMFVGAEAANPDTSKWDISSVTSMAFMFVGASSANPHTSNWDTSSVTDMGEMFMLATIANPDTSGWDTSSATNMSQMFHGATEANPDTSGWDTSNVQSLAGMFIDADAAIPDTSNWNTSNVTQMDNVFGQADLANPDTSSWDTSNVTTMQGMFAGAASANPDTSAWDTSSVSDMGVMFIEALNANPDTSGWDTSNVTTMQGMFSNAIVANPDMSGWNFTNVEDMGGMFLGINIGVESYSNLLLKLELQNNNPGVLLDGGDAQYSAAAASARAGLIADHGWIITDGGLLE